MLPNNVHMVPVFNVLGVSHYGTVERFVFIKDDKSRFYVFNERIPKSEIEKCRTLSNLLSSYCDVIRDSQLTPEQFEKIYCQN